jgi:hypothetical protein
LSQTVEQVAKSRLDRAKSVQSACKKCAKMLSS